MREAKSPSYFNPHEILLVNTYLNELLGDPTLGIGLLLARNRQCT